MEKGKWDEDKDMTHPYVAISAAKINPHTLREESFSKDLCQLSAELVVLGSPRSVSLYIHHISFGQVGKTRLLCFVTGSSVIAPRICNYKPFTRLVGQSSPHQNNFVETSPHGDSLLGM